MWPDTSAAADWRCRGVWGDDGGGGDNKNCGRRHGAVKESTTTEMPSARTSDTGGNTSLMVDVLFAWRLSWAWVGGINYGICCGVAGDGAGVVWPTPIFINMRVRRRRSMRCVAPTNTPKTLVYQRKIVVIDSIKGPSSPGNMILGVQDRLTWKKSGAKYFGGKRGGVEFDPSSGGVKC